MHAYIHTYIHPYLLTCLLTHFLTYIHACIHTYILTYVLTHSLTHFLTYMHACIQAGIHTSGKIIGRHMTSDIHRNEYVAKKSVIIPRSQLILGTKKWFHGGFHSHRASPFKIFEDHSYLHRIFQKNKPRGVAQCWEAVPALHLHQPPQRRKLAALRLRRWSLPCFAAGKSTVIFDDDPSYSAINPPSFSGIFNGHWSEWWEWAQSWLRNHDGMGGTNHVRWEEMAHIVIIIG